MKTENRQTLKRSRQAPRAVVPSPSFAPAKKSRKSLSGLTRGRSAPKHDFPIVVHSHLGWDWVWQRPQQFLSRLSKRHRILFVEGPAPLAGVKTPRLTLREVSDYPNIMVVQSHFPPEKWSDGAYVDTERRRLVKSALAGPLGQKFQNPVQWFYDPMAVTAFAHQMGERAIVYDCMDELSQFRGAPPELIRRERDLLAAADVVFAGGPKIGKAKRPFNSNCHSYGCGVDVPHFAKARAAATVVPADIATIPGPILGFFGVVDERMDYALIDKLARADKSWNIVIIGPTAKVDPKKLPQRPNLHWLGGRDYSELPAYSKRFDVCLMPFALNEATEYINPTKALEYMATGRPIVSSAVEDVVLQFGDVVAIADSHQEFIDFCRGAVRLPDAKAIERGVTMAEQNSWDSIVRKMERHIADVLEADESLESSAA